jgi:hypothetical protein
VAEGYVFGRYIYVNRVNVLKSPKKAKNSLLDKRCAISREIIMSDSLRPGDSGPKVKELQTLLDDYSKYIKARAISPGLPNRSTVNEAMLFVLSKVPIV